MFRSPRPVVALSSESLCKGSRSEHAETPLRDQALAAETLQAGAWGVFWQHCPAPAPGELRPRCSKALQRVPRTHGPPGLWLPPAAQGRRWVMVCSRWSFSGEGRGLGGGWALSESKACCTHLFSPSPACFPTSTTTTPVPGSQWRVLPLIRFAAGFPRALHKTASCRRREHLWSFPWH